MLGSLLRVRADERRPTLIAFFTLLSVMAGHGLLETARDALFLAKIPAARLPWVYLGVAAIALGLGAATGRRGRGASSRARRLSLLLLSAALVTLGFWPLIGRSGVWPLYALYVWSATIATLVVVRFWLVVSERFTVTQAKRVYPVVGAGSVAGAIAGTGLAGVLTLGLPARHLLPASAAAFALASIGPAVLDWACPKAGVGTAAVAAEGERVPARAGLSALATPYVRRVGLLVLLSTVTVTMVDYVFKSAVAESVAAGELGAFFARFYLVLNFVSLAAQLVIVRPVVRTLSTTGSLAVLPVLFAVGGMALAAGGGLAAALVAKGADGALRHSLHRTATELLYVPMADRVRSAAKTTLDVLGQRGGQALASLGILAAVALGAQRPALGIAVALLAAAWLGIALGLRRHYLDLFRSTLRESASLPRVQYPELDLSSLESVIAALNSSNDAEVRAALGYLASEGRARLIPALILYHPSPEVVTDAIEILIAAGRHDFLPITQRLLEHPSAEVRAAALRARIATDPEAEEIERFADAGCPALRATALVGLVALGRETHGARDKLAAIAERGDAEARRTLADAIRFRPSPHFEDLLIEMAKDPDVAVRRTVLGAMAVAPSARFLGPLVRMLAERQLRSDARQTLVQLGDMGLSFLVGALADEQRPLAVRRHLPRTIMRFDPQKAASALLEQLVGEEDGVVRYKILRALGFLRAHHPDLRLDRRVLSELIATTVTRTYQLVEWRVVLERDRARSSGCDTPTQRLLTRLLADKEAHAIERLFRLLGLIHPGEDVATIYRGLRSERPDVRASSRELIEHLLEQPLRDAVLGLIDDGPDAERLAAAGSYHEHAHPNYEGVLAELLEVAGESLCSIAVYHVGELGLTALRPRLEALSSDGASARGVLGRVTQRALELLDEGSGRRAPAPT